MVDQTALTSLTTSYQLVSGMSSQGDISGMTFSSASDKLTVTNAGVYKITSYAAFTNVGTNQAIYIRPYKNGSETSLINYMNTRNAGSGNEALSVFVQGFLSLDAGDDIQMYIKSLSNDNTLYVYNCTLSLLRVE